MDDEHIDAVVTDRSEYDGHVETTEFRLRQETQYIVQDGEVIESETFIDESAFPEAVTEEIAEEIWKAASVDLAEYDNVDIVRLKGGS